MPIMKKIIPSLLIVCGGVWLGYLTFSNMMHAYYGWLPEFLGENRKPEWSEEELKVMKRDLAESADRKLKARRLLDELRDELSDEEIAKLMEEETKSAKKAKKPRGGKKQ